MRHRCFVVSILLFLMSRGGLNAAVADASPPPNSGTPAALPDDFVSVAGWRRAHAHQATTRPPAPPSITLEEVDAIMALPPPDRDGLYAELIAGPAFTRADARARAGRSSLQGLGVTVGGVVGAWASHNLVVAVEGAASTALTPKVEGDLIPPLRGPTALTTITGGANLTYVRDGGRGRFSAALVCTQVRLVDRTSRRVLTGTGFGPGLELAASRDWWWGGSRGETDLFNADDGIGRSGWTTGLGLGASLRATVSRQSDVPRAISYTTLAVTLALSASYD